jgi:uncharacterized protein YeeX (DUF496 family)
MMSPPTYMSPTKRSTKEAFAMSPTRRSPAQLRKELEEEEKKIEDHALKEVKPKSSFTPE